MTRKPTQIYQIKITLDNTHPPIWRSILVPGSTTLLKLHDVLQIVMGWQDYHLHMFKIDGLIYGNPEDDEYGDLGTLDESEFKLIQVIRRVGQRFSYEYDFGDSWDHTLIVEKILPSQKGARHPLCLKGKRACPPEDVGGVWGYEKFLEAINDPDHEEHDDYLNWVGGGFDPEAFNLDEVNDQLRRMGRGRSTEALNAWFVEEGLTGEEIDLVSSWPQTLPENQQVEAEDLSLRRDVITLLTYLRDHKVVGTQSTGNLPLKAVHEICALFVNPPVLEEIIGEHVFRIRSEYDVRPLYFRHVLVSVGRLVQGGPGRRWKLTPLGERFLAAPPPLQVWLLLATWWTQINWVIAAPFGYQDGYLPTGFTNLALTHLLDLPIETPVSFESFADRLIQAARLVWPVEDQEGARSTLRVTVKGMVVEPLVEFGILLTTYKPHEKYGMEIQVLSLIQVTSFGKGLLKAIKEAMRQGR